MSAECDASRRDEEPDRRRIWTIQRGSATKLTARMIVLSRHLSFSTPCRSCLTAPRSVRARPFRPWRRRRTSTYQQICHRSDSLPRTKASHSDEPRSRQTGPSRPLKNSDGPRSASFRPDRTVDSRRINTDMPSNRRRDQDETSLDLDRAGVLERPASDIPSKLRFGTAWIYSSVARMRDIQVGTVATG